MNRSTKITIFVLLLIFSLTTGLSARGDTGNAGKGPITIASKFDTEGALLGNVMLLILDNGGFEVVDKTELGATDVVRKALETGEVDMYPEYTGNGNWFFMPNDYGDDWYNSKGALAAVRELDKAAFDMEWLEPAPANNTWAIAIRRDRAKAEGLVTLAGSRMYTSMADTDEVIDDALIRFEKVLNNVEGLD